MTPERWARVEAIFEQALARPSGARAEWAAAHADDPEMAALLGSMLEADASDRGELEDAVGAAIRAAAGDAEGPREGRIGPYRIVSAIGQGGMGTVYLAERADGAFDQKVAIKVVGGLLDPERVRRFRAERQILASLQHPNIARLLDGGTTDDGWPYLVMEHVEGQAIDVYAEQRGLSLGERLTLFTTVCAAVGHAHRHLIVHRDIKPSNILVTTEGTPKLLDFGIAKLLDSDDPDLSARTLTGMHILTPDYAAPEQVRGEPVTTVTDVYALGVLLYELVTRHRPHVFKTLTAQEIERVICDTEAPRPSTVRAGLPDDLDIIIGAALSKDTSRRYASVEALAEDLGRFLDGQPIQARPATWGYRAARFVSRHRWEVGVAAVFVAMLVAFSVLVSLQAARLARERDAAQQERDDAQEVSSFLVSLFEVNDPSRSRGESVTARELLDRGATQVETGLSSQPGVQARFMDTMGRVYRQLGLLEPAESLLAKALQRREAAGGAASDAVADTLAELGEVAREKGAHEEAERLQRQALAMRQQLHGSTHDKVAFSLNGLGLVLDAQARYLEAEPMYRAALEINVKTHGPSHPETAVTLNNLASLLEDKGDAAAAEAMFRQALAIRRASLGDAHPAVARGMHNLARTLVALSRYSEAETLLTRALEIRRQVLGTSHVEVAASLGLLAQVRARAGAEEEALALSDEGVRIWRGLVAADHPSLATALVAHSRLLVDTGRSREAVAAATEAVAIRRARLAEGHPQIAEADAVLADARAHGPQ